MTTHDSSVAPVRGRFLRQLEPTMLSLCGMLLIAGILFLMPGGGVKLETGGGQSSTAAASPEKPDRIESADRRLREGAELAGQNGTFRVTGDRIAFFSADGKQRLIVLENLALERVARAIADTPGPVQWNVTGTLTEYRGVNYLLLRRAVLTSRGQIPESGF